MSTWTHVAGIIRFDYVEIEKETVKQITEKVRSVMGGTILFEDVPEQWDAFERSDHHVPYGSEGSLCYRVIVSPDKSMMPRIVVAFWGDLRDRGESYSEEIMNWFLKVLKQWKEVDQSAGFRAAHMSVRHMDSDELAIYVGGEDDNDEVTVRKVAITCRQDEQRFSF